MCPPRPVLILRAATFATSNLNAAFDVLMVQQGSSCLSSHSLMFPKIPMLLIALKSEQPLESVETVHLPTLVIHVVNLSWVHLADCRIQLLYGINGFFCHGNTPGS